MYPVCKVAISQHLATHGFSQCDHQLSSSSVRMLGVYQTFWSQVILKCQPPICIDYRARNRSQLATEPSFAKIEGAIYRSSRKTCINHYFFFSFFRYAKRIVKPHVTSFLFGLKLQNCIKQQYHRVSPHEWTYLGTHQSWVMSSDFWTAYYLLNLHN